MELKVEMKKERTTKGAVMYLASTPGDKEILQNLYIRKEALDGEAPDHITVVVHTH